MFPILGILKNFEFFQSDKKVIKRSNKIAVIAIQLPIKGSEQYLYLILGTNTCQINKELQL